MLDVETIIINKYESVPEILATFTPKVDYDIFERFTRSPKYSLLKTSTTASADRSFCYGKPTKAISNQKFFVSWVPKMLQEIKSNGTLTFQRRVKRGGGSDSRTYTWPMLPSGLIATLFGNEYIDIDIQNSGPTILLDYLKKAKLPHKELNHYVERREDVIRSTMTNLNVDRQGAKDAIFTVLFSGYVAKNCKSQFLRDLAKEVRDTADQFFAEWMEKDPRDYLHTGVEIVTYKENPESPNFDPMTHMTTSSPQGVTYVMYVYAKEMNKYIYEVETKIIDYISNLEGVKGNVAMTNGDGLLIKKDAIIEKFGSVRGFCEYCDDAIAKVFDDIPIHFAEKKIHTADPEWLGPVIGTFKVAESYCWPHFLNEVSRQEYESLDELKNIFRQNINRVMLRNGAKYYIKQSADELMVHLPKSCMDEQLWYKEVTLVEKPKKKESDSLFDSDGNFNGGAQKQETKIKRKSISIRDLINKYIHQDIKIYNRIGTYPPVQKEFQTKDNTPDPDTLNLWQGFEAKLLDAKEIDHAMLRPALFHIFDVLCDGDRDIYNFVMSWFHNLFRYPFRKTCKMLVFKNSEERCAGKSLFFEKLLRTYIFKPVHYKKGTLEEVTGTFDSSLRNKHLFFVEELNQAESLNKLKTQFNQIKTRITSDKHSYHNKGKDRSGIDENDIVNMIGTTNNEYSVHLCKGNARIMLIECSNKWYKHPDQDTYFAQLAELILNQKFGDQFFSFCYHGLPLQKEDGIEEEWLVSIDKIVKSKYAEEVINACKSNSDRFVDDCREYRDLYIESNYESDPCAEYRWQLMIKDYIKTKTPMSSKDFYQAYVIYCQEINEKAASKGSFDTRNKETIKFGVNKIRKNTGVYVDLEKL